MEPQTNLWQDRRVILATLAAVTLLAVFLAVETVSSLKQFQFIGEADQFTNTITVQGVGEVFAVPDIAVFTFSVTEEAADASLAQDGAAKKTNNILSFIKEQGVEEKDIKTVGFNLFPRYEFRQVQTLGSEVSSIGFVPDGKRTLVGFEVNQRVQVRVRDTERAGQLIAGVSELGASTVSQLSFTIDDDEALKEEARSKAIEDAKEKADTLADQLDVKLVRILNFNEFGGPGSFARQESLGFGGDVSVSTAPQLPSGENKIASQVSITYEIR